MATKDPYQVLGVEKNASQSDIKKAFHKLALEKHPDRNQDPSAEEEFKSISAAYEILSDPAKRSKYDQYGDTSNQPSDFGGFRGGINLDDLINDMFGGIGHKHKSNKKSVFRGEDLHKELNIDFMDAINGCKKGIKLSYASACDACKATGARNGTDFSECKTCNGTGRVGYSQGFMRIMSTCNACRGTGKSITNGCESCGGTGQKTKEEKISVNIPKGADTGMIMRLAGKGTEGINGGPNGDLYLSISVSPHPKFKRDGLTIYTEEDIDYLDALLGTKKSIETLYGAETLNIPKLTQNGKVVKLSKFGVRLDKESGDHYIKLNVRLPEKISEQEELLLNDIRKMRS